MERYNPYTQSALRANLEDIRDSWRRYSAVNYHSDQHFPESGLFNGAFIQEAEQPRQPLLSLNTTLPEWTMWQNSCTAAASNVPLNGLFSDFNQVDPYQTYSGDLQDSSPFHQNRARDENAATLSQLAVVNPERSNEEHSESVSSASPASETLNELRHLTASENALSRQQLREVRAMLSKIRGVLTSARQRSAHTHRSKRSRTGRSSKEDHGDGRSRGRETSGERNSRKRAHSTEPSDEVKPSS